MITVARLVARVAVLAVVGIVAACGGVHVEQPKDGQGENDGADLGQENEQDDHGATSGDNERPAGQADEPRGEMPSAHDSRPDVDVRVAVDVRVDVTVDGELVPLEAFRYSPRRRAWQAAVDEAPAGYRLATRAELVALVDAGALDDLDTAGGPVVWSATEAGEASAQLVELESGRSAPTSKALELAALYVQVE